jgi:hypothetical protein
MGRICRACILRLGWCCETSDNAVASNEADQCCSYIVQSCRGMASSVRCPHQSFSYRRLTARCGQMCVVEVCRCVLMS